MEAHNIYIFGTDYSSIGFHSSVGKICSCASSYTCMYIQYVWSLAIGQRIVTSPLAGGNEVCTASRV